MPDYPEDELLIEQMVIPLAAPVSPAPNTGNSDKSEIGNLEITQASAQSLKSGSAGYQPASDLAGGATGSGSAIGSKTGSGSRTGSRTGSGSAKGSRSTGSGSANRSGSVGSATADRNAGSANNGRGDAMRRPLSNSIPVSDLDPNVNLPPPPESPDFSSLLQEKDSGGIEILVQMAQRGELDPKNIDIIDATDRFLRAVAAAPRENLRQSGKIIFHASVLLRLKAEALLITRIEDLDIGGDDFLDFDTEGSPIIYDSNDEAVGRQITLADLQRALVRRSRQQKQGRQRRVTLEQLIESLREAERLDKKRLERKEREPISAIQMDGYHEMEDMADILDLAHDEDIESVIARIELLLVKVMNELLRLSLRELITMMNGNGDWVDAFLAVLFLSNSGKINLEQEIFYGPLYLVKNDGADALTATGTDGNGLPGTQAASTLASQADRDQLIRENVIDLPIGKSKETSGKKRIAAKKPRSIIKKKKSEEADSDPDSATVDHDSDRSESGSTTDRYKPDQSDPGSASVPPASKDNSEPDGSEPGSTLRPLPIACCDGAPAVLTGVPPAPMETFLELASEPPEADQEES